MATARPSAHEGFPPTHPRPSRATTVGAAVLMLGVSAPFVVQGVTAVIQARSADALAGVREALVTFDVPAGASEASTLLWLFAFIFLVVSALALLLAAGVLMRRPWAREAGLGLFGLFAVLAFAAGLRGASAAPRPGRRPGRSWWAWSTW